MPVAPATWPRAAALEAFARSRSGTDEAAVVHAVASLNLALAPAGTGPVAEEYVRMENRKARGIATIYGPGADPEEASTRSRLPCTVRRPARST